MIARKAVGSTSAPSRKILLKKYIFLKKVKIFLVFENRRNCPDHQWDPRNKACQDEGKETQQHPRVTLEFQYTGASGSTAHWPIVTDEFQLDHRERLRVVT